jgi:hypothetical protein
MSCSRYFAFVWSLLWIALLFFPFSADCQENQPANKSGTPPPAPEPKEDPKAKETLKRAIEQLDSQKLGWVETRVWQQASIQGVALQGDGRYVLGPGHRFRTDLAMKIGNMEGNLLMVCDGATVWTRMRTGKEAKGLSKWNFEAVRAALEAPGIPKELIEDFYKTQALLGLVPLLQSLDRQLVFTSQEKVRWQNRDVLKLTGVWSANVRKVFIDPNAPWPLLVPHKCHLYLGTLEGKILWPYRIEWLGPVLIRGSDAQLLQLEFRGPRILKPSDKAAEKLIQLCKFQPGNETVMDRTKEICDQLNLMRQGQQSAKPPAGSSSKPGK